MEEERRILFFGFAQPGHEAQKLILCPSGCTLYFEGDIEKCPPLTDYDFIIIHSGLFPDDEYRGRRQIGGRVLDELVPDEVIRREKEIMRALRNGRIVCFLTDYTNDFLVERILEIYGIGYWFLNYALYSNISVKRSEFNDFLNKFGATNADFFKESIDDTICTIGDRVVGFSKKIDNGTLIFLPCHISSKRPEYIAELISTLSKSLISYSAQLQYVTPKWVDEFKFPKESIVAGEVENFLEEIDKRKPVLEKYRGLKSILHLRHRSLQSQVKFFLEEMGLEIREVERFEEDLWIFDQGKEQVVVEVKARNKNITREDINKLDTHRNANNLPGDFPALLIANTFLVGMSLKEKDVDISPNEINHARRNNILIMRTLDLCNVYVLIEKEKLSSREFLELLKTKTGWLRIVDENLEIK